MLFCTCISTVRGLRNNSVPICRLVRLIATSRMTSTSRPDRPPGMVRDRRRPTRWPNSASVAVIGRHR